MEGVQQDMIFNGENLQEKRQQTIVLTPKSGEHDPPRMLMLKP
jgi:hypothetical protein